jgi:threonine/homoserine/homoserine lactone efflux protein
VDGLFAVLAVTLVDYLYITLAFVGVGKLLERQRVKRILGTVSSAVLMLFGAMMIVSTARAPAAGSAVGAGPSNHGASFLSAFLLTISSPLTIVFWTSLFAAKAIERSCSKAELVLFGLPAGLSTFVFLGLAVVVFSSVKASIPALVITILNVVVGALLVAYGVMRLVKASRREK